MRQLKSQMQNLLRKAGIYQRVKASALYDLYWGIADRQILTERAREVDFYRSVLKGFRKGDLIFDIGANQGQKTDVFLRLGARVVAVDPDDFNQKILGEKFHSYRLVKKPVSVVGKAVSDRDAIETLWIDEPGSAKNTLNPKWVETLRADATRFGNTLNFAQKKSIETITLDSLIAEHGRPTFVKIDVEGHEVQVVRGLTKPVPYLSFEVNLPEFLNEGQECVKLLARLDPRSKFNFVADCQRGLALDQWIPEEAFLKALRDCKNTSIEVFWNAATLDA
jgi:FkbM family methyltransferase